MTDADAIKHVVEEMSHQRLDDGAPAHMPAGQWVIRATIELGEIAEEVRDGTADVSFCVSVLAATCCRWLVDLGKTKEDNP